MPRVGKKNHWKKSPDVEELLDELGIKYDYVTFPLALVKWDKFDNCGRIGFNVGLRDDYVVCFARGDVFPAGIVSKRPDGSYIIPSGRHRYSAAYKNNPRDDAAAYLIELDENDRSTYVQISLRGNDREGMRAGVDERLPFAMDCVTNLGMTVKEAANLITVTPETLKRKLRTQKGREKLRQFGVPLVDSLKDSMVVHLIRLTIRTVCIDYTAYVRQFTLGSGPGRNEDINLLKEIPSEDGQRAKIAEWYKDAERAREGNKRIKTPVRRNVLAWIDKGEKLFNVSSYSELQIRGDDEEDFKKRWARLGKKVKGLL